MRLLLAGDWSGASVSRPGLATLRAMQGPGPSTPNS